MSFLPPLPSRPSLVTLPFRCLLSFLSFCLLGLDFVSSSTCVMQVRRVLGEAASDSTNDDGASAGPADNMSDTALLLSGKQPSFSFSWLLGLFPKLFFCALSFFPFFEAALPLVFSSDVPVLSCLSGGATAVFGSPLISFSDPLSASPFSQLSLSFLSFIHFLLSLFLSFPSLFLSIALSL